ncbi:hypothetical protein [Haloparvum sp. PAK95]|uniref:hypothetical protein n=1 Tax=Haloparvum sp. PAK95 TaxID=3418962 RepID=UPI003D2F4483
MRRRRYVKAVGTGIATLGLSSTASARGEGELPNGRVRETRVNPFPSKEDAAEVPAGNWVTHYVGWVDVNGESRRTDIERWLDAVEFSASIDGEPIEDPDRFWNDPEINDDGNWIVWWEYSTPPKSEGVHTFTTKFEYPDGFEDAGKTIRDPGRTDELTGYYEVV